MSEGLRLSERARTASQGSPKRFAEHSGEQYSSNHIVVRLGVIDLHLCKYCYVILPFIIYYCPLLASSLLPITYSNSASDSLFCPGSFRSSDLRLLRSRFQWSPLLPVVRTHTHSFDLPNLLLGCWCLFDHELCNYYCRAISSYPIPVVCGIPQCDANHESSLGGASARPLLGVLSSDPTLPETSLPTRPSDSGSGSQSSPLESCCSSVSPSS